MQLSASGIAPALAIAQLGNVFWQTVTESQIAYRDRRIDNFDEIDEIDDLSHPLYKNGWSNGTFTRKIHQNLLELIEPSHYVAFHD